MARVIYWFRTDLRLHDSPALQAALDLKPEVLFPIWCWDSHYVYHARVGPNRWQFLLDCMEDTSARITKLNPKSKLFVIREPAVTVLPKLFKSWNITHLVFEKDTDSYGRDRDAVVVQAAKDAGVECVIRSGRTLWDSDEIVKANGGKPTMSITQLQAAGEKVGPIADPLPTPTHFPDPGDVRCILAGSSHAVSQTLPAKKPDFNVDHRVQEEESYGSGIAGPEGTFRVPTMEEMGLRRATTPHRGGETLALKIISDLVNERDDYVGTFEKPKTSPAGFNPPATCFTSAYHHFGALSCRYFFHEVEKIINRRRKEGKAVSSIPVNLLGQLLFRDMYFAAQAGVGYPFQQAYNNPICRFVPWHLPSRIDMKTKLVTENPDQRYEIDDPEKNREFHRWAYGFTGFPWIDAIMRQLRLEGWIHHLARHAVSCFLTRGGCYISWERGSEVFEELLIDHEHACNDGNWMWLACTAFYTRFMRCYSPTAFGKNWDEKGDFIRHYVPELKDMPAKYIYEPWKAPNDVQKQANVKIEGHGTWPGSDDLEATSHKVYPRGGAGIGSAGANAAMGRGKGNDEVKVYPLPMFDFNERRTICLEGMKAAYSAHLYGTSKPVLDGTWKALFDDTGAGATKGSRGGPGGLSTFDDAPANSDAPPSVANDRGKKGKGTSSAARQATSARGKKEPRIKSVGAGKTSLKIEKEGGGEEEGPGSESGSEIGSGVEETGHASRAQGDRPLVQTREAAREGAGRTGKKREKMDSKQQTLDGLVLKPKKPKQETED